MTRLCYDSTNAADLPRNALLALAYVDGYYGTDSTASPTAVHRHCPQALVATVTVKGGPANMADVEPGDLNPQSAAAWARGERNAGRTPTLYFPVSWHDQIVTALQHQNLKPGRDVLLFGANYNGQRAITPGYIGIQYSSPDGPAGTRPPGHYDISVVADHWPGVDPPRRFPRLVARKRRTAQQLTKELRNRGVPVPQQDRGLLAALAAQIHRLLRRKS